MTALPPPTQAPPPPAAPAGAARLAIAALVLSLLLFIPLAPLVGGILGLVGLRKIGRGESGRGMCIAAIPVGFVLFLLVQVLPAVVSVQAFNRFVTLSKASEAREGLHAMRYGVFDAAMQERVDASGNFLPPNFPVAETAWAPTHGCCAQPSLPACQRNDADWDRQPWRAMQWKPEQKHHYQYRYTSNGRTVTVEARGDLDCDGEYSLFTMKAHIEDQMPVFDGIESVREEE